MGAAVLVALAAGIATTGASSSPAKTTAVRVVFTGNGGGRYLDTTRWIREDTRECYARRTADETLSVSWRIVWTVAVVRSSGGYAFGRAVKRDSTIAGSVTGKSVRDFCDAAEEEPGWGGSDLCETRLSVDATGGIASRRSVDGANLLLRGPVFRSPGNPCELQIRNDQLAAHVPLPATTLARLAAGHPLSLPVGTRHPRPGDSYTDTRNCSPAPRRYEGVVYFYDCDDTLIWAGRLTISSPSR